jgi:transposase
MAKLGIGIETLRYRVKQAEVDTGTRPGTTTEERRRLVRVPRTRASGALHPEDERCDAIASARPMTLEAPRLSVHCKASWPPELRAKEDEMETKPPGLLVGVYDSKADANTHDETGTCRGALATVLWPRPPGPVALPTGTSHDVVAATVDSARTPPAAVTNRAAQVP